MESLNQDLAILKLEHIGLEVLTIREVNLAYKRIALKIHPDKTENDSTAEFQELSNAHQRLLQYLIEKPESSDDDGKNESKKEEREEEQFTRDNFSNFNFPTEKDNSYVVIVQNEMANLWSECF